MEVFPVFKMRVIKFSNLKYVRNFEERVIKLI